MSSWWINGDNKKLKQGHYICARGIGAVITRSSSREFSNDVTIQKVTRQKKWRVRQLDVGFYLLLAKRSARTLSRSSFAFLRASARSCALALSAAFLAA